MGFPISGKNPPLGRGRWKNARMHFKEWTISFLGISPFSFNLKVLKKNAKNQK